MKPHPRIRKTIKWAGAAVTVLLLVVWIGSGLFTFGYRAKTCEIELNPGQIRVFKDKYKPDDNSGGFLDVQWQFAMQFRWGVGWLRENGKWEVLLPLWLPSLVFGLITAAEWWTSPADRRSATLKLCPKCGYDRTGLVTDAKCPECGSLST